MKVVPVPKSAADAWDLRRPERQLLLGCLLCVSLGFVMVVGSGRAVGRAVGFLDFLPLATYALCLIAVHLTLVLSRFRGDQVLPVIVALLAGIGLLAQYRMGAFDSADPWATARFVLPLGVLMMLAVCAAGMRGRYQLLASVPWVWAGLSLALLAVVLATGQRFRGGIYGAGFITPTEALKVTVPLFLAGLIDRDAKALRKWGKPLPLPPFRELAPLLGFWALLAGLLFVQRDLGMFVVLSVALLVMLAVGTGRMGYLIYGVLAAVGVGYLVLEFFLHGQRRIQVWQTPFEDPTGDGWQILQGLTGMYSGGLWGEGFGRGNPEYTPIAESDFIYSVIGEELGFIGCAVVVIFFLAFFARGLHVADRIRSPFGMLLCTGLTSVIATQTFLNIGGVTKFIPLTGITLPFISQGGSSLLAMFVSLGLILAMSDGEIAGNRRDAGRFKNRRGPRRNGAAEKPLAAKSGGRTRARSVQSRR